jgi:dTDP-4-amino-4,6-dideoxygalactose transaminase
MQKVPLSKCYLSSEVREAVLRALESGSYILGKECAAFEAELAAHTGTKYAVLCSSWTMGVFLLHQAMGLRPGDEVLVPSHTAFPSIEPLIHCGGKPVFIDIDDTYCLDVDHLAAAITPRTVGILPVHLYGHPANLQRIFEIAQKHHLWVIEDCAQAQGAQYQGKTVGSLGMVGAFSFYPSKNLTVLGDGGCLTTNDAGLVERLKMLRNHGRKEKYTHEITGFNVRFNEIQAAVGRVALKHLDQLNDGRRQIAAHYAQRLQGLVTPPAERPWAKAVHHMYVVRAQRRDELAQFLKGQGIETGIHYPIPNHQQPAVEGKFGTQPSLPRTEQAVKEILSLPMSGELTLAEADRVCDAVAEFYRQP